MKKRLKHQLLNYLESKGWDRNPKEEVKFKGKTILSSKSSFKRKREKDDAWLYALGQHCDNIMDIGCNMGQSSMLFALGDPDSMICVDPNPKALSRCAENLIFNDLSSKVRFVNAFVSDQENVDIEFYSSLVDAAGSMFKTFAKTSSSLGKVQMVAQHKGDSICDQLDFSPDLVKVDVEGAELKVLNGFAEVSARENTLFFVEVHSGEELSIADNTRNIIEWAENAQYKVYYMKDHSLLRDVDRIKHRGRFHVLLVPQSDQYPDYLRSIPEYGQIELFEEAV